MTETKDQDKTLRGGAGAGGAGGARKPLSLQRTVESGSVRQNFSHGRSKSVVVEKRKTRKLNSPGEAGEPAPAPQPPALKLEPRGVPPPRPATPPPAGAQPRGDAGRGAAPMSQAEQRAREEAQKQPLVTR